MTYRQKNGFVVSNARETILGTTTTSLDEVYDSPCLAYYVQNNPRMEYIVEPYDHIKVRKADDPDGRDILNGTLVPTPGAQEKDKKMQMIFSNPEKAPLPHAKLVSWFKQGLDIEIRRPKALTPERIRAFDKRLNHPQ